MKGDCPGTVAPELLAWAWAFRSDTEVACVLPHPMFETWFAVAESLRGVNGLPSDLAKPPDPEGAQVGKRVGQAASDPEVQGDGGPAPVCGTHEPAGVSGVVALFPEVVRGIGATPAGVNSAGGRRSAVGR